MATRNIYIQQELFYLSFEYLINSIYENLKNNVTNYNLIKTENFENYVFGNDDIIVLIGQFAHKFINLIKNKPLDIKILLINAEPIYLKKIYQIETIEHIATFTTYPITVIDYNINNIEYIKKSPYYTNDKIKVLFIPWTYNNYILNFPNTNNVKDIDILFMGHTPVGGRRAMIRDILIENNKNNYNIQFQNNNGRGVDYNYNQLNRAKIIINIFNHENNKIFDFYRFNILLSNKFFFITEDFNIETDNPYCDYASFLITSTYEKLPIVIFDYLVNYSNEQRCEIANDAHTWYKNKMNFDENIINVIREL